MTATNWRYVCPRCGSCSTRRRTSGTAQGGRPRNDGTTGHNHWCEQCERPTEVLYDKKLGVEVKNMSDTIQD